MTRKIHFVVSKQEDSNFEEDFCSWLAEKHNFPASVFDSKGKICPNKVNKCLPIKDNKDKWRSVLYKAYEYIVSKQTTHYISSVLLGAAEYHDTKKMSLFSKSVSSMIGNINNVESEDVIEYEIMPLQELIKREHKELRFLLQEAIGLYFKGKSKLQNII